MPLDPQAQAVLDYAAAFGMRPLTEVSPQEAREMRRALRLSLELPIEPVARVEDRRIPGPAGDIPVRVYTPDGASPFPGLIYYHGGGWVLGGLDSHDALCRLLARTAGCVVVAVDYRLAPEHRFPAAVDDVYAAAQWIYEHAGEFGIDPARLAVGGDSAGGTLATVVCYLARERGTPTLVYQVLIYPVAMPPDTTASQEALAEGYGLTLSGMRWFFDHYLRSEEDFENPLVIPMRIADLSALPPALIITAEYDLLRDEGEAYADRLREAGVPVLCTRYPGMLHGFLASFPPVDARLTAAREIAEALKPAFTVAPAE